MVPVAQETPSQETTANTVRLPCPIVSAVGLAWWHGAKRRWRSSMCIRCRSLFCRSCNGG